ncbi:hypothetical protein NDU88_004330 [Pleurodeles waltl]|uniref:Uncharacterized protein n=1 Tax=Pleurodeles waltl TaxID=8319 RepID=A0AAV7L6F5_PLEWA|nr:hypothetical protein NDU88_004330 [Pleurodeles waltl]
MAQRHPTWRSRLIGRPQEVARAVGCQEGGSGTGTWQRVADVIPGARGGPRQQAASCGGLWHRLSRAQRQSKRGQAQRVPLVVPGTGCHIESRTQSRNGGRRHGLADAMQGNGAAHAQTGRGLLELGWQKWSQARSATESPRRRLLQVVLGTGW